MPKKRRRMKIKLGVVESCDELKEILNDFTMDHRKLIHGFKRK